MTERERIAGLEAHRVAHEDRHERFEQQVADAHGDIRIRLDDGQKRFGKIDTAVAEVTRIVRGIADGDSKNNGNPGNGGPKGKRDVVIRIGIPAIGGGGLVAFILWLIQTIQSGSLAAGG